MANQNKMGNLLKFTEYDQLQPKQSPTKYTEVGGFAILENLTVRQLLEEASKFCDKSKKELENETPNELKNIIRKNKKKNLLTESSAKQKAARKKFMEMIAKKKSNKISKKEDKSCCGEKGCKCK